MDERRNCLFKTIKQNDLMSKKYRKTGRALIYLEYFFIFISAVGCSAFQFLHLLH